MWRLMYDVDANIISKKFDVYIDMKHQNSFDVSLMLMLTSYITKKINVPNTENEYVLRLHERRLYNLKKINIWK